MWMNVPPKIISTVKNISSLWFFFPVQTVSLNHSEEKEHLMGHDGKGTVRNTSGSHSKTLSEVENLFLQGNNCLLHWNIRTLRM